MNLQECKEGHVNLWSKIYDHINELSEEQIIKTYTTLVESRLIFIKVRLKNKVIGLHNLDNVTCYACKYCDNCSQCPIEGKVCFDAYSWYWRLGYFDSKRRTLELIAKIRDARFPALEAQPMGTITGRFYNSEPNMVEIDNQRIGADPSNLHKHQHDIMNTLVFEKQTTYLAPMSLGKKHVGGKIR